MKGRKDIMNTLSRSLAALAICATLAISAPAYADAVNYWNEVTLSAVSAGRPGPPGLFDIALVQAAVHDAVQTIEGRYEPYHFSDPSRQGIGSTDAAVAAASHRTLVLLYPNQKGPLDSTYEAFLLAKELNGDPALATGEAAAVALHSSQRRVEIPMAPFYGREEIGQWRSPVPMAFRYAAYLRPFTLNSPSQFRPAPPPPLTSGRYSRDYDEVRQIGNVHAHPNADTEVARFWSVNFLTQWNEALRQVAGNHLSDEGERARLMALANLAAADALIAIWDSKLHYNLWRPSTAIRQGNDDGNQKTPGDPGWSPLIADPPYPDYVSGANGLTGAFTGMLQHVFGTDDLAFSVRTTSSQVASQERFYTRISQAAQEVVDARILLGIHFRFADEEGRRLGQRVAQWTFTKYLRPVR
jgi:hypothetical protein